MSDVFIMLPDMETYSVACFEAMSTGLPVLVSNTGGFPEGVPTHAGFLVSPNHPEDIDMALSKLIADPQLRVRMGLASRSHVMAYHTWDQVAKRYLELDS
jgi:glycosyltransferase involved in cell wall biosynthesis